ncbi:Bug family tripartite tricarboxylate transporter substrate binding protein [Cupriavidus basilensis]|uniref:Bug family tripartite tricarboxylate transporter substrate binding protein n=1 Tax=Cupriavidus basilensis TaxID=68895 RepID=UPI00157A5566|nr:tripartite tricarboxylate transporter substrate binding protein [Cupriavidus basilensis]NUA26931.1 tripartite tricarboxylate transporter substrate binding protein [Cupriavidus basilensis]
MNQTFVKIRKTCGIFSFATVLLAGGNVMAQGYPDRPVKLVVPYPAGSSTDALARILSEALGKRIRQAVVVENRAGAGGMIGAKAVSDSPSDGNTLLMYTPAWPAQKIFVKNPAVPVPDGLKPVSLVALGRLALVAPQALPAKTFAELISYAQAHPGKLNYSTTGPGDVLLDFEILKSSARVQMEHIQYKGAANQLNALLANEVQLGLQPEYTPLPFVKDGKLKVLAVTGDKRSTVYPDAPTFKELGLPKIRNNWMAIFAPGGTPPTTIKKLNADLVAVINTPEVSKRFSDIYFEAVGSTPEQLRQQIQMDITDWAAVAKSAGIQPE